MEQFIRKHVSEPYFTLICEGKKTTEGRLYKDEFVEMKNGDIIEFFNDDEIERRAVRVEICDITRYPNFEEYLKVELENALPNLISKYQQQVEIETMHNKDKLIDDGVKIYRSFYSEESEKTFGVAAIRFKLLLLI